MNMKKSIFLILLNVFIVLFTGCKKTNSISINENCSIEYSMNEKSNTIQTVKICNGKDTLILSMDDYGSCFKMENNNGLTCNINYSAEGLLAYQILNDKKQFSTALNLYEDGSTSYQINTLVFSETTNALFDSEGNMYSDKNILFPGKKGYYLHLSQDGHYKIEYADENRMSLQLESERR